MPTGALLDPSNRLLGAATGDFSLYGALPAVAIGAARAPAADTTLLTVPLSDISSAAQGAVQPQATTFAPDFTEASPLPNSGAPAAPFGAALHDTHAPTAFAVPILTPQVASSTGGGSIAPIVEDTPLPATALQGAAQAQSTETAGGLTQGLAATSLAAPVFAAPEAIAVPAAALAPVLAMSAPVIGELGATIGDVTTAVAADLAAPVDTAASGATTQIDSVVPSAAPAIEATAAAAAQALPEPAAAVEPVAEAVAVTAAATVETLAATSADAADLTAGALPDDQFAGTDPAGGVTTLVSMVESAAMFEVGQPADTPEAATATGSIVDALAADETPEALLGDAAHAANDIGDGALPDDHGVPGLI